MHTETDSGIQAGIRASRMRVARSRGALSGAVLVVLGAWAGIVPFIGPYFNFAFTPAPNSAWHWTADRGWLDVLPGAAAVLAGLILLFAANRVILTVASWLGVAAGAWLIVGPVLAARVSLSTGIPDPTLNPGTRPLVWLFFYYATGAAILFFATLALGRLSVHSVRDARSAQRRVEAAAAREEERRRFDEQQAAARYGERDGATAGPAEDHAEQGDGAPAGSAAGEPQPSTAQRRDYPPA